MAYDKSDAAKARRLGDPAAARRARLAHDAAVLAADRTAARLRPSNKWRITDTRTGDICHRATKRETAERYLARCIGPSGAFALHDPAGYIIATSGPRP